MHILYWCDITCSVVLVFAYFNRGYFWTNFVFATTTTNSPQQQQQQQQQQEYFTEIDFSYFLKYDNN